MAARALLFDVDGTLWDSYPWYADLLAGLSGQAREAFVKELFAGTSVVTLAKRCGVTDGRFRLACRRCVGQLRLYAGVRETLMQLMRRGTPCAVVTSLPGRIVGPLLESLDLTEHFPVIVHAGTVRPLKPNPAPLRTAARQMDVDDLRDVFYVGDGAKDAEAASRAGMRFAWAAYGYGGDCPHDAVVLRAFDEVLAL
jgi:HAD superfamily hydrolase (TIGR01509 family)